MAIIQTGVEKAAGNTDHAQVLNNVVRELQRLPDNESRARVLHALTVFYGLPNGPTGRANSFDDHVPDTLKMSFSNHPTISPKEFMAEKAPATDVERVACLAYYLSHFRDLPHFKTLDISKLNTEAAQFKFSNAAFAVNNASKLGYLVPASKGTKQLSAAAEQFVKSFT